MRRGLTIAGRQMVTPRTKIITCLLFERAFPPRPARPQGPSCHVSPPCSPHPR
jgi:hypothetical protein